MALAAMESGPALMPDVRGDLCDLLQTVADRIEAGDITHAIELVHALRAVLAGRTRGATIQ